MKTRMVVGIGLLLLCSAVPAVAGPEVYVLGGVALANLGGDASQIGDVSAASLQEVGGLWTSAQKMRTGFDGGLGVSFRSSNVFGEALEVRYVTRGAKWDIAEHTGSGLVFTGTMKLNYIEIPALLQVTPPFSGPIQPLLVIGPVFGFKGSSDFEVKGEGGQVSQSIPGMKSANVGGLVGAGFKVSASPRASLLLQARYQRGFTNLVDDSEFNLTSTDFSVLAGMSFEL